MVSHEASLSTTWGRAVRRWATDHPELGIRIAPDAGAAQEWETAEGGGILSRSVGGSITGRGFKVLLLDDLIKDFGAAHSEVLRQSVWDWRSEAHTSELQSLMRISYAVFCLKEQQQSELKSQIQ